MDFFRFNALFSQECPTSYTLYQPWKYYTANATILSNFRRNRPGVPGGPPQRIRLPHEAPGPVYNRVTITGRHGDILGSTQQAIRGRPRSDCAQKAKQPLHRFKRRAEPHEGDQVEQENVSF